MASRDGFPAWLRRPCVNELHTAGQTSCPYRLLISRRTWKQGHTSKGYGLCAPGISCPETDKENRDAGFARRISQLSGLPSRKGCQSWLWSAPANPHSPGDHTCWPTDFRETDRCSWRRGLILRGEDRTRLLARVVHSSRMSIKGSTESARRAGIQVATSPSNNIARTAPANTSGSRGVA